MFGGREAAVVARPVLRVLVASDQWFPDVRGGVARVAAESARRLAALGHEVTALVPERKGREPEWEDRGVRVLGTLRRGALPQTLTDPIHSARARRALGDRLDVVVAHGCTTAAGPPRS